MRWEKKRGREGREVGGKKEEGRDGGDGNFVVFFRMLNNWDEV